MPPVKGEDDVPGRGDRWLTRRKVDRQSGQALLELALVAPILIVLAAAIFQFAYVFQTEMGLTNAIREAARRAAATSNPTVAWVRAELCGADPSACDAGLFEVNVQAFDDSLLAADPSVTFCTYTVDIAGSPVSSYRVTVSATYRHPVFFGPIAFATDFMDGVHDGRWEIGAAAQMRLERGSPAPIPGACP
jgi:Flp pilus assembly protein TadG